MRAVERGEISRPDALVLCKDLFEGGVDVPANLMANAVLALADHPDQRAYLVDRRTEMAQIGSESKSLRASTARSVPPAHRHDERHSPRRPDSEGSHRAASPRSRKPRRAAVLEPGHARRCRSRRRNLAFGAGVHFCVGAPLARLEASLALPALFSAIPDYEVIPPVERPRGDPVMRALLSLEVATTRRAA